jgi:hypothetical protein
MRVERRIFSETDGRRPAKRRLVVLFGICLAAACGDEMDRAMASYDAEDSGTVRVIDAAEELRMQQHLEVVRPPMQKVAHSFTLATSEVYSAERVHSSGALRAVTEASRRRQAMLQERLELLTRAMQAGADRSLAQAERRSDLIIGALFEGMHLEDPPEWSFELGHRLA